MLFTTVVGWTGVGGPSADTLVKKDKAYRKRTIPMAERCCG